MTLQEYIKANSTEKRHNQQYWAEFFGMSQAWLSLLLRGERAPGRELIGEIARRSGGAVPASVWFEAETK